ncbi:MAG: GYF domain-containing protein [Hyphomicrobiaceae bacterium]
MTEKTSDIQWHIARDGQQHGPLSNAEIKLFVDGGHLLESDLIWQAEFTDWRPAFEVFPPTKPSPADTATASQPVDANPAPTKTAATTPDKAKENRTSETSTVSAPDKADEKNTTPSNTGQPALKTLASVETATTGAATSSVGGTRTPEPITQSNNPTPRQAQNDEARQNADTAQAQHAATGQSIGHNPNPSAASPATGANMQMAESSQTPQAPYVADDLYAPQKSGGAGRRIAIAAGILAVVAGGGWWAINNNPTVAEFATAAMNATTNAVSSGTQISGETQTTPSDTDESVKVVKAPDTPNGSPPAAPPETQDTTTASQDITAAPAPDATPTKDDGQGQVETPTSDPIETAAVTPPPAATAGSAEPVVDPHYTTSPLWIVVREQFPNWYGERMREIEQLSKEKPKNEVATHALKSLVFLRRENAATALAASSNKLRSIASAFLANLQSLKAHSTEACFSFISKGETSPAVISLYESGANAKPMEAQATAVFEAIAEGRKSPQSRSRPQKPDYDVLATELGQLGWSQADLQLFANPTALARAAPERVCQMVEDWFTAHIAIEDEAIQERLLFETLRPVIAG